MHVWDNKSASTIAMQDIHAILTQSVYKSKQTSIQNKNFEIKKE